MTDTTTDGTQSDTQAGSEGAQTFTQADVDAAVDKAAAKIRADERRKVTERFADYDDLKAKADGAKTLEDRLADLEGKNVAAEQRALRAEVANAKNLTPGQAKRLQGSTLEELEADADDLLAEFAATQSERKKNGNRVSGEGTSIKQPPTDDEDEREFARNLFGGE